MTLDDSHSGERSSHTFQPWSSSATDTEWGLNAGAIISYGYGNDYDAPLLT
jgi:hypothetical protein